MNIYAHTRARESMLYKLTSGSPRYAKSVSRGGGGGGADGGRGLPLPHRCSLLLRGRHTDIQKTKAIRILKIKTVRILKILAYWYSKNKSYLGLKTKAVKYSKNISG